MVDKAELTQWIDKPVSLSFRNFAYEAGVKQLVRKKTTIFQERDILSCFYYLEQGLVAFYLDSLNGESRIVSLSFPGRAFAIGPALDQLPVTFSTVALENCEIYRIHREQLIEKLKSDPALCIEMVCNATARARSLCEAANIFSNLYTPREKVFNLFSSLQEIVEDAGGGWYALPFSLSHTQIGQIIGASRITVCRLFQRLKQEGRIRSTGQRQFIHGDLLNRGHNHSVTRGSSCKT